ncbi:MAG: MFS transporter [Candidatus Omnitrophica bacterium]|nr:MFS transporter [Candidatus Omnitrophota bacterium]
MSSLTFVILCFEGAILSFNVAACAALVPSVAQDLGVAPFVAGRIVWLYMLPYGIAALLYGPLVRLFDAKKIELVCFSLFSLANLLAFFAKDIYTLYAARILMGLFGASVIPLILILIAKHCNVKSRGKQVGLFFSATFVASLLGLLLSGFIHWRLIFLIPALAGFVLLMAMYAFLPSFKEDKSELKINYLAAFKQRAVLSLFTYIFLISLLYHGIQQWLGVYFSNTFNFSQLVISILITLTSLSGIFGEVVGGLLSDSLGRLKTVKIGIVLMIVSVFVLLLKLPLALLAVIMVIWGFGWTLNHAGLSTMLTDLPKEFLNEAASLNSSVRFVSGGIGAALAGMVMQHSFTVGFVLFGTCLVLLLFFNQKLLGTLLNSKQRLSL